MTIKEIHDAVRVVSDFPKKGIQFRDISSVLENPELFNLILDNILDSLKEVKIDGIAGVESRGFIFGTHIAQKLNVPFYMVRKKGKLPLETFQESYDLEYGSSTLELHKNAIKENQNILIHDDLLATGGTAEAAAKLVIKSKAKIAGFSFVIDLEDLKGLDKLSVYSTNLFKVLTY